MLAAVEVSSVLIVSAFRDGAFYGQAELQTKLGVGRSQDNGLVLDDPQLGVSRYHAELEPGAEGSVVLTDLGGPNGTLVNGSYISTATLHVGDQFVIGPYQLVIEESASASGLTQAGQDYHPPAADPVPRVPAPPASPVAPRSIWTQLTQPKAVIVLAAAALLAVAFAIVSAVRDTTPVNDDSGLGGPAEGGGVDPETIRDPVDEPPPVPPGTAESENTRRPDIDVPRPPPVVDVPRTPPKRPTTFPMVPGIQVLPQEDAASYRARTLDAADRVARSQTLARQERFDEARQLIQSVLAQYPAYADALAARQVINDARATAMQRALADAAEARSRGDLAAEAAALERAQRLEPSAATSARLTELGPLMSAAGEKAFHDGENYENFRQLDQARQAYQSAVRLLPRDHELRPEAERRLRGLGK